MESTKKAVIYVRGENKIQQEMFCYFYAYKNDIDVLFVANDIDEVTDCEECNMVLVANASRISRNAIEYHQIVNALMVRGIEVVSTISQENVEMFIDLVREGWKKGEIPKQQ